MSMLLTCFGTLFLSPDRFLNFAVFIGYSSFKYPIAVVNNLIFVLHISFFFFFFFFFFCIWKLANYSVAPSDSLLFDGSQHS